MQYQFCFAQNQIIKYGDILKLIHPKWDGAYLYEQAESIVARLNSLWYGSRFIVLDWEIRLEH